MSVDSVSAPRTAAWMAGFLPVSYRCNQLPASCSFLSYQGRCQRWTRCCLLYLQLSALSASCKATHSMMQPGTAAERSACGSAACRLSAHPVTSNLASIKSASGAMQDIITEFVETAQFLHYARQCAAGCEHAESMLRLQPCCCWSAPCCEIAHGAALLPVDVKIRQCIAYAAGSSRSDVHRY
jgi:hypothetical protein